MKRVKKGEKFWRIWAMDNRFEIRDSIDDYGEISTQMYEMGNYFRTEKAAQAMVATLLDTLKLSSNCKLISLMQYLDENRPKGKMCLSNGECEQLARAWRNNDWDTIVKYIKKYALSQCVDLSQIPPYMKKDDVTGMFNLCASISGKWHCKYNLIMGFDAKGTPQEAVNEVVNWLKKEK